MSDVKWIKILTDIFEDEKMVLIDAMPERDSILLIWIKLLCLAGKQNNGGVFMLNEKTPYTDEMLATLLHRPLNTTRLALSVFEQFGMIEIINGTITIPNWEKHQALDAYEKRKEYDRIRKAQKREQARALIAEKSAECPQTRPILSAECPHIEREEDKEERYIYNISTLSDADEKKPCPYQKIRELFNSTCVSFTPITAIEGNRKKTVAARWHKNDSFDAFAEVFRIAEASDYLKGQNDRNWKADFDWLMRADNFAKVREHKYDNRVSKPPNFAAYNLELVGQMLKTGE